MSDGDRMVVDEFRVNAAIGNIAAVLEKAASRLRERQAGRVRRDLGDMQADFAGLARDVAHDVQSCMGNLHIDTLILACADADREARREQPR